MIGNVARLFTLFQVHDLIQKFLFTACEVFATLPAFHRFLLELQRVADAPHKKCANGKDDEPRVGGHRVGNFDRARAFLLQKEQYQTHHYFSLTPHSAQNLLATGLGWLHEGQTLAWPEGAVLLFRDESSCRIST